MLKMVSNRSRRALKNTVRAQRSRTNRVLFDALEDRRLFTLIPIAPLLGYPQLQADNPGIVSYAAGTGDNGSLHAGATTIAVLTSPTTFTFVQPSDRVAQGVDLDVQIKKSDGSFAGGVAGWDLEVRGKVTIDSQVYDGVLLVGEATQFGFADSGNSFDFRFTLDGGLLAGLPAYAGKDLGVVLNRTTVSGQTSPQPFPNLFNFGFGGGAKVFVGPIPTLSGPPLPASIAGVKYQDITGNGFSTDDTPLANVTINLFKDADNDGFLTAADGASIASVLTGADGSYKFENLPTPGRYFVQEGASTSYVQTAGPAYYTVTPAAGEDVTGLNFDNFKKITVSGTKYNDLSGNGLSADDQPLAGVTIQLIQGGNVIATTTTDSQGHFSFPDLGPGMYSVQEETPAGWTQTAAATTTITATSGVDSTGNDFANFHNITITGTKTQDITGNGFSADDAPLAGITIQLIQAGNVIATTTTAADGSYKFENLGPGTYSVQEVLPAGYVQTAGQAAYTITASSGQDSAGNDFANFKQITISGTKYNDITGDGITAGDQPLAGVTVNLYKDGSDTPVATTVTGANGTFSFPNLGPGSYTVKEVVPAGWVQTAGAAGYTVVANSGADSSANDFANFKKVTITGTKYEDITGNSFSADDTPLAGVTINLYNAANPSTPIASTVTAANGSYSFADLGPGTYFVQEVVPTGYTQTGGVAGYTIAATSGLVSGGNNFANWLLTPGIDVEKTTNGPTNSNPTAPDYDNEDAANGPGVPALTPGSAVTWTYKVTNTGNVPFTAGQIALVDDNGTVTTADDLSIANGQITFLSVLVGDADNILEPGESWLYKASGTVQNLSSAGGPGSSLTFDFSGNSSTDGTDGNVRTFTAGSVSVHASAFSRDSYGNWSAAYLGSYGGGLGVTDSSEGSGSNNTHTVDNSGRDNYVLLEFSESVILDSAYLGYVVGDSDMTVWIGTLPAAFDNHITLSDSVLASLGFTEVNLTSLSSARTADLNAGNVSGNVVVLAARIGDSNDYFKVQNVTVCKPVAGIYENKATVTVPGASDSDLSHYRNPTAPTTTAISGTKFRDVTGNGLTSDDVPLAGITIKLYQDNNNDGLLTSADGSPVKTTTTAADGSYSFTGLTPGKYLVQEVVTGDYVRTAPALQDYYAVNASAAGQTYTGFDFANFDKNDCFCAFGSYYFLVNGKKVTDLRGNTNQGDKVQAVFTIKNGYSNVQVSLVSYKAPASYFDANTAYLQQVYQAQTGTYGPGTYTFTVYNPDCYYQVDFVCGAVIDTFGPAGSNIFYTPQNRLISADNDGCNACFCGTSTISGTVFKDLDNDGDIDANESGIKNVKVLLTGYNDLGQYVEATDYTDSDGFYQFTGLRDGTYKVTETQPTDYLDGKDDLGSLGGTLGNDVFSNITIAGGNQDGINYNFGEISKTVCSTALDCDMTATIGFWQNRNGQCLIKSMNGSSYSTKLGNWLASNFPNLFGNTSGTACNLSGKTNSQVADAFVKLFNCRGTKIEAQVMATALSVYVTDSDLAGGNYARSYGFIVNSNGTGAATFNVGSNGSAIGLTNYKSYTISQILAAANNVDAFDASSSTQTKVNNLFTSINEKGDI